MEVGGGDDDAEGAGTTENGEGAQTNDAMDDTAAIDQNAAAIDLDEERGEVEHKVEKMKKKELHEYALAVWRVTLPSTGSLAAQRSAICCS